MASRTWKEFLDRENPVAYFGSFNEDGERQGLCQVYRIEKDSGIKTILTDGFYDDEGRQGICTLYFPEYGSKVVVNCKDHAIIGNCTFHYPVSSNMSPETFEGQVLSTHHSHSLLPESKVIIDNYFDLRYSQLKEEIGAIKNTARESTRF
jgi:hypothetical protein